MSIIRCGPCVSCAASSDPGGRLILMFDVGHEPSPTQPNALSPDAVRSELEGLTVTREHSWDEPFGHDGHRVVLVAELLVAVAPS